jgi:hypothetical protein
VFNIEKKVGKRPKTPKNRHKKGWQRFDNLESEDLQSTKYNTAYVVSV